MLKRRGVALVALAMAGAAMAAGVDVLLVPGGCYGVFTPEETPGLTLVVSNRTAGAVRLEAKLRTFDYFGNEVGTGAESLEVAAKGAAERRMSYPGIKGLGFFCTVAEWKAGELSGTSEGSFVKVGPYLEKPDRLFGISCFCGNETELFRRMGVGTKGVQFNWGWLEDKKNPAPDNCDLGRLKAEVKDLRAAGIRVVGMVDASDGRIPRRYMKKNAPRGEDPIADVPNYYKDYATFYRTIAAAFKGDISDWSAGTEINLVAPEKPYMFDRHIDLTRIFSRSVKSVDPDAVVLGICVSGGDGRTFPRFPYMRRLAPMLKDCLDGVAPDQYTDGQDYGDGLVNLNSEQAGLREIMQDVIDIVDRNGMKRVAIDEKGPSFVRSLPISSPKGKFAADMVAREFVILKTLPRVDHWLYFRPFNWSTKSTRDWGMWERGSPRQVVAAYAATARLMAHAEFVKGLDVHGDVPCWTFRKDGRHLAALWYNGDRPLAFRLAARPLEVLDVMGCKVASEGGEVTLGPSPVYVQYATQAELEKAILGAKFSIPSFIAMLETMSSDRTVLMLKNKGGRAISVKATAFAAEPAHEMPEALRGAIALGPNETKSIDLDFSAGSMSLTLDAGDGAPLDVRSEFKPVRVKRIGGWDEIGKCPELRLDNPIAHMPGHADLKQHGVYQGPDDISIGARFGYDDEAFYAEYVVKDDIHGNKSRPARVFVGDCVQFAFDARHNARTGLFSGKRGFDDDDYNFVAGIANGENTLWCYVAGVEMRGRQQGRPLAPPDIVRDEAAKTTRYRVRLPFAAVAPLKPEPGRVFGFSFLVFDYDPPATGSCQLRLTSGVDNPASPADFKSFMFE